MSLQAAQRRSRVRRRGLSLQTVQGGRGGGIAEQSGGLFEPACPTDATCSAISVATSARVSSRTPSGRADSAADSAYASTRNMPHVNNGRRRASRVPERTLRTLSKAATFLAAEEAAAAHQAAVAKTLGARTMLTMHMRPRSCLTMLTIHMRPC